MELHELQINFTEALVNCKPDLIENWIITKNLSGSDRLQIHYNNYIQSLTKALRLIYPLIEKLVGIEYFKALAREYIKLNPSYTKNLTFYGEGFSQFLIHFSPLQSFAYLPEMARLEWSCHEVYYAPEGAIFDINSLRNINEGEYRKIRFNLNPTCRLLDCQFPVHQIWKACQNNPSEEIIVLNGEGDKLLISRIKGEVNIEKLSNAEFNLLAAFSSKKDFEAVSQDFFDQTDLYDALKKYIFQQVIVDFSI